MDELLRPTTDAGALVQVGVVLVVTVLGTWRAWGDPDRRRLVTGVGLLLLALMGLRAAH